MVIDASRWTLVVGVDQVEVFGSGTGDDSSITMAALVAVSDLVGVGVQNLGGQHGDDLCWDDAAQSLSDAQVLQRHGRLWHGAAPSHQSLKESSGELVLAAHWGA